MKICHIMCHTGEEFGISSDSQYASHFGYEQWYCKALTDQGCDVTLIVLSYRPRITQFQHVFGHRIIRIPISWSLGISKQLSTDLFGFIKNNLEDMDIFHIHSYYAWLYEPLAIFLKLQKRKFVAQCHTVHSMANPLHLARLGLSFFSLRLAERIITVNLSEYQKLRRILKEKAVHFPNGVDTTLFRPLNRERRNCILFVGRLSPEKGVEILLKALEFTQREVPDISLTIVGVGPLDKLVFEAQKRLGQKINYYTYKSQEELVELYNTHALLVLPSIQEAFGIVVLESLACETPVITTERGVALRLKSCDCVETVPANDYTTLSNKILALLRDPHRRRIMGEAGRKVVVRDYDWKILGRKLVNMYNTILD